MAGVAETRVALPPPRRCPPRPQVPIPHQRVLSWLLGAPAGELVLPPHLWPHRGGGGGGVRAMGVVPALWPWGQTPAHAVQEGIGGLGLEP